MNASVAAGKIDPALLRLSYSVFSKYHIQLPPPRSAVLLHSSNNNKRTEKKGEEGRGDRLLPRKRNRKANDATNSEPVVVDAIAAFCYVSASHRRLLLRRLYVYNKWGIDESKIQLPSSGHANDVHNSLLIIQTRRHYDFRFKTLIQVSFAPSLRMQNRQMAVVDSKRRFLQHKSIVRIVMSERKFIMRNTFSTFCRIIIEQ